MNKKITILLVAMFALTAANFAQVSINNISQVYTQDFNTLANSGSTGTALPAGWNVINNIYNVGTGSSNSGAIYSYGAAASDPERALGSLPSGSLPVGLFGVKFTNNTGVTITKINVSFMGEMWRLGSGSPLDSLYFDFSSTNNDSVNQNPGSWTNVPALSFITPDTSGSFGTAKNGNVAPNRTFVSGSVNAVSIANGSSFWIRWRDHNSIGSDDGMAIDSLTVSFEAVVFPACTEPANSVPGVVLNSSGTTSVSGSFTPTTPGSDGYIVLVNTSTTAPNVVDGVTYAQAQVVDGATVASVGTSTSFSLGGLLSNTIYYAHVFPYNNVSCTGGPNYKTSAVANDSAKTDLDACPEPSGEPTDLEFTSVTKNSITGKFNKAVPAPTGYVVVFSTSSNVAYPLDSISYNAGDSITFGSFKSKVAFVGTDSNFTITGLDSATRYHVAVIPYNTCLFGPNYNRTTPLREDTVTLGTPPLPNCSQPTGVSTQSIIKLDSTATTISIQWTNSANGDSVLVFAGNNATIGFVTIHDSVYYGVGSTIPSSGTPPLVYYRGKDSSVVLTGLTANTVYKIFVVAFNNTGCVYGPNYGGLANVTIKTATGPTGVKLNKETAFSLYPNPVNEGSLYLQFSKPLADQADLEVVDMIGRKMLSQRLNASVVNQTIDVSGLAKGVYYINIWYKGDNSTVPFVVQ